MTPTHSNFKIQLVVFNIFTLLLFTTTQAQKSRFKQAEKLFNTLKYQEAANEYQKIYDKGFSNQLLFKHLADCYYFNTDMQNAYVWYGKLFEHYKDSINPEYFFRYAHALQGVGKNDEAKKWMKRFSKNTPHKDRRKINYVQAASELDVILKTNSNYELKNVATNTTYSDFGVAFYGDQVVYASSKTTKEHPKTYYWNNQPYLNIYKGIVDVEDFDITYDEPFSENINTEYHESNAIFNKELTKVYFTRNNFKKKLGNDKNGVNHLKLYSADLQKNTHNSKKRWVNIQELPFNSNNYSVGHPALSPDEKQLYFASDMPGAIGGTDLFVVDILENNTYSKPKNLGPKINTSGREMFPFMFDNQLYFASDGHLGFGGLDIFKSNLSDQHFQNPANMGKPINSSKDDFAFVFNKKLQSGFISSNRKGGKGDDDIYVITPIEEEVCTQKIDGIVTNARTNERIANANLSLFDASGNKIATTTSNEIGTYNFNTTLECNTNYTIKVSKSGYKAVVNTIKTQPLNGTTQIPLTMETLDKLIVEEKGILKLKIGIIYFNLNKDLIRNDAAIELNKIVLVMTQYPKMHLKIESHTDSRAAKAYNKDLSDRRAKSTRDYIISQGIEASRIESAIGYGESQLINQCADGVPCSELQHQENRRSEFIITKI